MLVMKIFCAEFERKNPTSLVFLLTNCPIAFMTHMLNIIVHDFGI